MFKYPYEKVTGHSLRFTPTLPLYGSVVKIKYLWFPVLIFYVEASHFEVSLQQSFK
jgi:hypothetical protein